METTVSGGDGNEATGVIGGTVGGGGNNKASGSFATIGGGVNHKAIGGASTIGGGNGNDAKGDSATVCGGVANRANGKMATVPGGNLNVASGDFSFAAGKGARTEDTNGNTHDGAVVFGDSSRSFIRSQGDDEFRSQMPMFAPSFNTTSARAKKERIEPVEPEAVLETVTDLDVSTWQFKDDGESRHMGPMAGEFADAFGLGDDEDSIATVDADGVALAAIQGLAERLDDRDAELAEKAERIDAQQERIDELDRENGQLRERLATVEDRITGLETGETAPASTDD